MLSPCYTLFPSCLWYPAALADGLVCRVLDLDIQTGIRLQSRHGVEGRLALTTVSLSWKLKTVASTTEVTAYRHKEACKN
jgi:hypothetical protein